MYLMRINLPLYIETKINRLLIAEHILQPNTSLKNYRELSQNELKNADPIKRVVVENINLGEVKTHFLYAHILPHHLGTGEGTERNVNLRDKIRDRGNIILSKNGKKIYLDDCGHIIAASYGGKMLEFNLFPQNKDVNRGYAKKYLIWRAIEYFIFKWLSVKFINPSVDFTILMNYNDGKYPHRPSSEKIFILLRGELRTRNFQKKDINSEVFFAIKRKITNDIGAEIKRDNGLEDFRIYNQFLKNVELTSHMMSPIPIKLSKEIVKKVSYDDDDIVLTAKTNAKNGSTIFAFPENFIDIGTVAARFGLWKLIKRF